MTYILHPWKLLIFTLAGSVWQVSHQPTRQQERQMRRFKSPAQAQRFLAVHAAVHNLFRYGRHLLRAPTIGAFENELWSVGERQPVSAESPVPVRGFASALIS